MVGPLVGEMSVMNFVEFLPEVINAETPIVDFRRVSKGGGKGEKLSGPFVREQFFSVVQPLFKLTIV